MTTCVRCAKLWTVRIAWPQCKYWSELAFAIPRTVGSKSCRGHRCLCRLEAYADGPLDLRLIASAQVGLLAGMLDGLTTGLPVALDWPNRRTQSVMTAKAKWKIYEEVAHYLLETQAKALGLGLRARGEEAKAHRRVWYDLGDRPKGRHDRHGRAIVATECRRYTTSKLKQKDMAALAYIIRDIGAAGGGPGDYASDSLLARLAVSIAWTMVAAASPSSWSCTGLNGSTTSSRTRCA